MGLNKNQLDNLMELISSKAPSNLPQTATAQAPSQIQNVQGDILGAIQRLNASGVDTSATVDNRNFLEKGLNLTPDQNFLFDFFEILNRPQQALFGAIEGMQTGEDAGQKFMAGLTGNEDFYGGEIVRRAVGQEAEKTQGESFGSQMGDWTNWAGLVLDVVADPLDLGLAFVTGGASTVAQVSGKVASTGADAVKVAGMAEDALKMGDELADLGETIGESFVAGMKAEKATKTPTKLLDTLQDLTLGKNKRLYIPKDANEYFSLLTNKASREHAEVVKTSLQNMATRPLFAGLKAGTLMTDSILEAGLKPLNDGKTLDSYRALKDSIKKTAREGGAKVKQIISKSQETRSAVEAQFSKVHNDFIDAVKAKSVEAGVSEADVGMWASRVREYLASGQREMTTGEFVDFITSNPIKRLPYNEETLSALKEAFGDEFISKYVKQEQMGQFNTLVFDDNAFHRSKYGELWSKANKGAKMTSMDSGEIGRYEKALLAKDPETFKTYKANKDAYEAGIADRVDERMDREWPKASERFSPDEVAKKRKSVEKAVRLEDLNTADNYQNVLKRVVKEDEMGNYLFNKETRAEVVKKMNVTDQVEYNRIKAEEDAVINAEIERTYARKDTPADEAGKKAYRAKQNALGAKLRAEGGNAKSDAFLSKVRGIGSEDTLMTVKTREDIDKFINELGDNEEYLNRGLKDRIKFIRQTEEELATATTDKEIARLKSKLEKKKDDLFTVLSGKELPKKVMPIKVAKEAVATKITADTTQLAKPISRDLTSRINTIIEESGIENKGVFTDRLNKVLNGEMQPDKVVLDGLKDLIEDYEGSYEDLTVFLQKFDNNFGTQLVKENANMLASNVDTAKLASLRKAEKGLVSLTKPAEEVSQVADEVVTPVVEEVVTPEPQIIENPQQVIDNIARTIPGNVPDEVVTPSIVAKGNGKIKIGNYYTPEQIAELEAMKDVPWVKDIVGTLDETIKKTQRIIGTFEFENSEALISKTKVGYLTHDLTREAYDAIEKVKTEFKLNKKLADMNLEYFAPGKTSAVGGSDYIGSIMEANAFRKEYFKEVYMKSDAMKAMMEGVSDDAKAMVEDYFTQDLFAEDARASVDAFMTKTYSAINKNHRTTDIMTALAFGNADGTNSALKVIKDSESQASGFVKLSEMETRKLKNTIAMNIKYGGTGEYQEKLMKQIREGLGQGKVMTMEKHLYDRLLSSKQRTGEAYLQFVDGFTKMFKMGKTLSPGFNFKNMVGNATNMWLAGVPAHDIFKYWNQAMTTNTKMSTLVSRIATEGFDALSDADKEMYKVYREFADAGFMSKATVYRMQDLIDPSEVADKGWEKGFKPVEPPEVENFFKNPIQSTVAKNMQLNLWVDNNSRLALYMYAKNNPEILTKAGLDPKDAGSAMNLVRLALFDPNDLSFFEDDVMKRLVPFYTFTRQNLAFQAKNVVNNSDKYYKMYKAYNSWNKEMFGLDKEDLSGFQRNQFYLPVFGKEDGTYVGLKTSLPMSAITELSFDPKDLFQQTVSKLSPLIKAPLELASGTNMLSGLPIQNYQGEMSKNIPIIDKMTEWGLSQVGADVPAKDISGLLDMIGQGVQGKDMTRGLNTMSSITTNINPEQNQLSKAYDELERLNAKIKAVKGAGGTVLTLAEINAKLNTNDNSQRLTDMQNIMDMINKIKR